MLENWWLFPVSIGIATIAMSSGIGGAVFFSPLFLLVLGLSPTIAIGSALITELFGFSSGVISYRKAKLIDYGLAKSLLVYAVPAAIVGSLIADYFPGDLLKGIFAVGLIFIGWQLFTSYREDRKHKAHGEPTEDHEGSYESELIDASGTVYKYTVCNKWVAKLFSVIGGALVGMISVGLAELQEYHLVAKCKVPTPVAVATAIFTVVITVFFASLGHIYHFVTDADSDVLQQVMNVVLFTIPGVIIGGQIGPMVQKKINPDLMKVAIIVLFITIGFFILYTLFN